MGLPLHQLEKVPGRPDLGNLLRALVLVPGMRPRLCESRAGIWHINLQRLVQRIPLNLDPARKLRLVAFAIMTREPGPWLAKAGTPPSRR
jgi:hypothetical protein